MPVTESATDLGGRLASYVDHVRGEPCCEWLKPLLGIPESPSDGGSRHWATIASLARPAAGRPIGLGDAKVWFDNGAGCVNPAKCPKRTLFSPEMVGVVERIEYDCPQVPLARGLLRQWRE
jgi:hypothetical protein